MTLHVDYIIIDISHTAHHFARLHHLLMVLRQETVSPLIISIISELPLIYIPVTCYTVLTRTRHSSDAGSMLGHDTASASCLWLRQLCFTLYYTGKTL